MALIRRVVNLDVFWSNEATMVLGMYQTFNQGLQSALYLGLNPGFLQSRPTWPLRDKVGFGEAMIILRHSLKRGKTLESSQQFDSVRKLRSLASNSMSAACPQATMDGVSFKDKGKILSLNQSGVDSALFGRFIKGCEKRMGRIMRQDMGLSVSILLKVLSNLESDLREDQSRERKRRIVMLGSCLVVGFCDALRGNEIFLVEATHLCQYAKKGREHQSPHVIIPLMGRFKGETGERNVIRLLARTTASGIQIGKWVDHLVKVLKAEGRDSVDAPGPAFCDERGVVLSSSRVNDRFHAELIRIQETHSELIQNKVDVTEIYNIHRSLRRGATSRASELNYTETMINLNNRWRRKTQTNKGKGGLQKMSQLYVEVSLIRKNLIAFSASL